ncbi:MAG: preprotein translocase subunit YajC [Bacteroidia bacterium]|nr:preprotein translocase subunit YajC [Bacteroidia bacterium]
MNLNFVLLQAVSGNFLSQFLPIILVVVVFYFFMIRPQAQKSKKLKEFREKLQKGDKVITIGGIHGKVLEVGDTYVMLEVDNGVKIKFEKSAISIDGATLGAEQK